MSNSSEITLTLSMEEANALRSLLGVLPGNAFDGMNLALFQALHAAIPLEEKRSYVVLRRGIKIAEKTPRKPDE